MLEPLKSYKEFIVFNACLRPLRSFLMFVILFSCLRVDNNISLLVPSVKKSGLSEMPE